MLALSSQVPILSAQNLPLTNARYRLDYLNINTERAEFSPVFYRNGLVFCAEPQASPSLDLLYLAPIHLLREGGPAAGLLSEIRFWSESDGILNDTNAVTNPTREASFQGLKALPETINSPQHDGPATFTHAGNRIVFSRTDFKGSNKNSRNPVRMTALYTAESQGDNWINVQSLPFNSRMFSTSQPAFSPDDRFMYFASDRPGGFGGMDLYVVSFSNNQWGTPKNLGPGVNTGGDEVFPFVDENGNLYFASDGHPGFGGLDLFYTTISEAVPTGLPVNLGAPLNSSKDDFGILTDGERKGGFLSSNRWRDNDDIYRFVREPPPAQRADLTVVVLDHEDRAPLDNVEVALETKLGRIATQFTARDGHLKFALESNQEYVFRTSRTGYLPLLTVFPKQSLAGNQSGRLEIQVQKFTPNPSLSNATPTAPTVSVLTPVSKLRGIVRGADGKPLAGVIVTLYNECGQATQQFTTGVEGSYEFFTVNNCNYTLEAQRAADSIPVPASSKAPAPTLKKPPVTTPKKRVPTAVTRWREGDIIPLIDIHYDVNQTNLRPAAARELDRLASTLRQFPQLIIEIRSHTDSRGDAESNRRLSQQRADAVADYLALLGINRRRMQPTGYGETLPLNECADGVICTEAEYRKNRRTEFKIIRSR